MKYSISDLLVAMFVVAVCAAMVPVYKTVRGDYWIEVYLLFASTFFWLSWILFRILKRRDTSAGYAIFFGGLASWAFCLPGILYSWGLLSRIDHLTSCDVLYFLAFLGSMGGMGSCIALGILFFVRRWFILGAISLLVGLWWPLVFRQNFYI